MRRAALVASILGGAIACGGESPPAPPIADPGSSVTGTVGGQGLFVADAIVTQDHAGGRANLGIVLSAQADACGAIGSPDALDALTYLYVTLSLDAPQIAPATYAIASADAGAASENAVAYLWRAGANCTQSEDIATSGSVTIDVLTTDGATGTFSIDFPDGHFDGTFDAPTCTPSSGSANPCR